MYEPLCSVRDVVLQYRGSDKPALKSVSLDLHAGEILGIRGKNGAGKSTLMAVMAGCIRPDSGSVRYGEGVRGSVAYVPQELSLYESMTGLENLRFWGIADGLPSGAIRIRSRWLLEVLHLTEKARSPVFSYSGGMKRRLHLASALMVTPKLLFLDEPTVGADAESVSVILHLLRHIAGNGTGILVISHQFEELEQICSRVLTLEDGKLRGSYR